MSQFRNVYGFDTETDNDGTEAWIAQWALHDGQKAVHGTDLRSFVDDCLKPLRNKGSKVFIYIMNLKYDLEFIKYGIHKFCQECRYTPKITMRKNNPISIRLDPQDKYDTVIHFRDLAKKMQGNLREIGHIFGVEKLEGPAFAPGWSEGRDFSDPEEWTYVHRDAEICAVAAQYLHKEGFTKATSSGDAWATAKKTLAVSKDGKKRYKDQDFLWKRYFPTLPYELDHDLRDGYFGGINISENIGHIKGKKLEHLDITSMYPTCLYWDPMPIDYPTYTREIPADGLLWIGKLHIKLNLKPNRVAWFQFKNAMDCQMEGIEFGKPVVWTQQYHYLTLNNVDFVTLLQDYDIEEDPDEYGRYFYVFKSKEGIFRPYIDRFIKQKNEAAKGSPERAQAKIMLNALYGRFALIPEGEETQLIYDEDEDDLKWVSEPIINEDMDAYLPYALWCTSYARARLLNLIRTICEHEGADKIVHSDTDSVIHIGDRIEDAGIEYDAGLGTWATESKPVEMYEGGFKRYFEVLHSPIRTEKDVAMACAGVPQHCNHLGVPVGMWVEILDNPEIITTEAILGNEHYRIKSEWLRKRYTDNGMDPDDVNTMKLIPEKVRGGVILRERQHRLSDNLQLRFRR